MIPLIFLMKENENISSIVDLYHFSRCFLDLHSLHPLVLDSRLFIFLSFWQINRIYQPFPWSVYKWPMFLLVRSLGPIIIYSFAVFLFRCIVLAQCRMES